VLSKNSNTDYDAVWAGPAVGFRNLVINGGFDVWQRGTSSTMVAVESSSFLADRWSSYRDVAGSTISRVSAGLDGFQYAMRLQRDSGNTATNTMYVGTSLETSTATKLANKVVTLSFYARAGANYSATTNNFTVTLQRGTGTEKNGLYNAFTASTSLIGLQQPITTSWQRYTFTTTMSSTVSQLLVQFAFSPNGTAGANDYVEFTGVQLEANTQPTPFEQRPYGVELALCQRYYYQAVSGISQSVGIVSFYNTTNITVVIPFPVTMRTSPSGIVNSGAYYSIESAGNTTGLTSLVINSSQPNQARFYSTNASGTTGYAGWMYTSNAGALIAFSAEL
jgi:hypothetical protein